MNYGSISYIYDGSLYIPEYLLRPFNIDNNTNLTILSYTTPSQDELDEESSEEELKKIWYSMIPQRHDIIITPIAFRLWPFLVRAKIYLQDRHGAVASISNYLAMKGMNILSADCHRGGFRYMVYNCVLECSEIRLNNENKYNELDRYLLTNGSNSKESKEFITLWKNLEGIIKKKVEEIKKDLKPISKKKFLKIAKEQAKKRKDPLPKYKSIKWNKEEKNKSCERDIINQMQQFLFIATKDEKKKGMEPEIHKSSTLPFHFFKLCTSSSQKNRMPHYSKYSDGSIKLPESYLAELKKNHKLDLAHKKHSPTFGLVNVDTNAPRIRVTITQKPKINDYRRIIIDYRRDFNRPMSSEGFMALISDQLTSKYKLNLQNIVNRIWVNDVKMELGKVEFIAEKSSGVVIKWKEVERDLKNVILKHKKDFHNSKTRVKCTPINPYRFFISLKTSDRKFVQNTKKLLFKAGEKFGIAKEDFRFVWTHSAPVTESVIQTLKECNALIQIYHSTKVSEDNFIWLDGEFLAMRALNKPCVRICSDKSYFNDEFSQFDKDVMPSIINFAHGNKKIIQQYRDVLFELINRIEFNEPNILNRFL